MAVYKDKDRGTWFVVIRYTDEHGKPKSKMKRGFQLKRDAIKYEHHFRSNIHDSSSGVSFSDVFNGLMDSRSPTVKPQTIKDYQHLSKIYFSALNNVRIDRLNMVKIQETVNKIKNDIRSRKTKNETLTLLKATLRFANNLYGTSFKVDLIKSIPKSYEDIKPHKTWSDDDFSCFIKQLDNPVYLAFFSFLYKTGARKGEAINLTWDRVKGNKVKFVDTKTLSSNRTISIDPVTLELMHDVKHGKYVFGGERKLKTTNIQRIWDSAIERAKIERIKIHDLRHSHATNLINAGANIVAVSRRLGHSDVSMTLRVYTHLLKETEEELLRYL